MSQQPRAGRPTADPAEVAAKIAELVALEARDSTAFAEALADNIMDPVVVETEAFRSEELAFKSLSAAKYLLANAKSVLARRRRGSEQQRRTEGFMQKVAYEGRLLDHICTGIKATKGIMPNAPNPRRRAERRLVNENLRGPVKQGRIRELIEEEKQLEAEKKQRAKKERQAARRAARNGG